MAAHLKIKVFMADGVEEALNELCDLAETYSEEALQALARRLSLPAGNPLSGLLCAERVEGGLRMQLAFKFYQLRYQLRSGEFLEWSGGVRCDDDQT